MDGWPLLLLFGMHDVGGCDHWPLVDTRGFCGMDSGAGVGFGSAGLGAV